MQLIYFPYAIPFIIAVIVNLFTVGLICISAVSLAGNG
jgi:hypothetical protein